MSLRALRSFLAVARHGSFAAAAGALGITQSAVSLQMRSLEGELRSTLFDRSRRTPTLTAAGRALLPRAGEIVARYDILASALAGGDLAGTLQLGAVPTVQSGVLPDALLALRDQHPDIQVRVVAGLSAELAQQVERGTLDAACVSEPVDDEKLGLHRIAKYYYYPGFWEGGPALHSLVNTKAMASLPPEYKAILEAACEEGNAYMMSRYDALNPVALKKMIASGTVLKVFPRPVMEASYKAAQEAFAELNTKSADFKKLSEHYFAFQRDQISWFRVCENPFDDFMAHIRRT